MKIVHISDIHIHPEPVLGLDPVANFRRCIAHVEEHHADADRIVITGDLTHRGLAGSYAQLKDMLGATIFKGHRRPRLLIGNHDSRAAFLAAFPNAERDANGFVQWTEETEAGTFVYMDTAEAGRHFGRYCAQRRQWLNKVLAACHAANRPAWLFMHHNPTTVHVANADRIGIIDEREMKEVLGAHRDTIRHIFFGHCHYTLSGSLAGIPFSAPRSTNHACWPDFSGIAERMGYGELQPNYNVCFLTGEDVVIHSIDFLDEDKVRWLADE